MVLRDLKELNADQIVQNGGGHWKEKIVEAATTGAQAADRLVRNHLSAALGVAFGLGLALSLFSRKR